jgi:hypothetical protein
VKKINKPILWAIVLTIAGLVITSAAGIPVQENSKETYDFKIIKSEKVPQFLKAPTQTMEVPLRMVPQTLGDPAFAYEGNQLHPALARDITSGTIMSSFFDEDLDDMIWTFSVDDGVSFDPGIYYEGMGGDYPALKLWDIVSGYPRFFGTFVTDYLDASGGPTYLYEINDATNLPDTGLNPLLYWDWAGHGWHDMMDADIACDSSQNTWEWGVSSYVTSTTYGDGYTDGPTITYSDEETSGRGWISWYYYDGCDHCDVSIDNSKIYSYAVYDWEDTTAGYFKLLCRVNDFDQIMSGADNMYEIDDGSNLYMPAVAAENGNIVILAETDAFGNKDIVCFYGTSISSLSTSFVADTGVDERFPDVRYHAEDEEFCATFVKNGELYSTRTADGGATWSEAQLVDSCEPEYKTSDLCELGAKAMYEIMQTDIDIYIDDICVATAPVIEITGITGGLGVTAEISNTGSAPATNVPWTITVTGGLLKRINVNKGDTILTLNHGDSTTVKTGPFLGFGKITIQVTAGTATASKSGFQLIIYTNVK